MPYEINIILIPLAILLLLWAVYKYIKERLEFYRSLGATVVGYHWLINPKAELVFKNLKFELFTSGPKGLHYLKLRLAIKPCGYLKLKRMEFLDKVLLPKTYKNLLIEYDEESWAHELLKIPEFEKLAEELFSEAGADYVELRCNSLTVGWHIRRSPKEVDKEKPLTAVELIAQSQELLNSFSSAQVYKENLREWLTIRAPLVALIISLLAGLALGLYEYQPICYVEAILIGYKWLFPLSLIYTAVALLLVGNKTLGGKVVFILLLFYLLGSPLITISLLTYVNGHFDRSKPELKSDVIKSVYRSRKGSIKITLRELHGNRWWCEGFTVSEDFYARAHKGAKVEYWTKKGLLGIQWFYTGLRLQD